MSDHDVMPEVRDLQFQPDVTLSIGEDGSYTLVIDWADSFEIAHCCYCFSY